ncbi:MAG: EamA family transporter [Microbacteriaceae bacterium]
MTSVQATTRGAASGIALAVSSALAFGLGGIFASPLLAAGWSPGATAFARVLLAAVVLSIPAAVMMRGRWASLWRARWRILAYAVVAVAGTQLAFYAAITRIPVGTALLVQYLAPILLIVVIWARTKQVPARIVLIGSGVSVAGLLFVIGPSGLAGTIDVIGLGFSALAMIGVATYFVLSAVPDDGVPPVALAASGFALSAVVIAAAGVTGILPFVATFETVALAGLSVAWWMPLVAVVLVSTAFAYVSGITAAGMLGARTASFLGLLEVVFATGFAWILLGQALAPVQVLGSALVVVGVVVVKLERSAPVTLSTVPIPIITMPIPIVDGHPVAPTPATGVFTAPIDIMSVPTALPTTVPAESLAEPTSVSMPMSVTEDEAAEAEAELMAEVTAEFEAEFRAEAEYRAEIEAELDAQADAAFEVPFAADDEVPRDTAPLPVIDTTRIPA